MTQTPSNPVRQAVDALGGVRKAASKIGASKSHVGRACQTGKVLGLQDAIGLADAYLGPKASKAARWDFVLSVCPNAPATDPDDATPAS